MSIPILNRLKPRRSRFLSRLRTTSLTKATHDTTLQSATTRSDSGADRSRDDLSDHASSSSPVSLPDSKNFGVEDTTPFPTTSFKFVTGDIAWAKLRGQWREVLIVSRAHHVDAQVAADDTNVSDTELLEALRKLNISESDEKYAVMVPVYSVLYWETASSADGEVDIDYEMIETHYECVSPALGQLEHPTDETIKLCGGGIRLPVVQPGNMMGCHLDCENADEDGRDAARLMERVKEFGFNFGFGLDSSVDCQDADDGEEKVRRHYEFEEPEEDDEGSEMVSWRDVLRDGPPLR